MARGFMYAPGSSPEVDEARADHLSKDQVVAFGQSKNSLVREIIAARSDCPLGIIVALTHDRETDVRVAVAGNPSVSRTVMEHLAEDKQVAVLEALLGNPALPSALLEAMAFHRRSEVRSLVAARLDGQVTPSADQPDGATPELRDRVFEDRARARDAEVLDISTGKQLHPQPEDE
ncbi:MAG: hypothetical protein WDZ57_02530, partial [Demequina sp.]